MWDLGHIVSLTNIWGTGLALSAAGGVVFAKRYYTSSKSWRYKQRLGSTLSSTQR